jgi:arylsulfatase
MTSNRRQFISTVGALLAGASFRGRADAAAEKVPNIIYIMADDLGYAELGCYGQKKIRTPNIDQLAAEGMRFTQFYAGSAVCAPSRCCLMTGKHGGHAYVRDNFEVKNPDPKTFGGQLPLPESEQTIAEVLKARGYATACFGKWGLGGVGTSGDPLKQGFDRFYGYNCQRHAHNLYPSYLINDNKQEALEGNTDGQTGAVYAPQRDADEMLKFIREHKDGPFFIYHATVLPHLALQVPEEDLAAYRGQWPETPYEGKSYQPHKTPRACYAAMISFMDKQVGRLMALLKELGIDGQTIVIFTSDNGATHLKEQVDYEFFESVGKLRGLKGALFEGGIRVPLVARWPGRIKPGSTSEHAAASYDVLATLGDIGGGEPPKGMDGLSFLPELLGREQKPHEYLFWDFGGYGGQLAVRMGNWKGIKKDLRKNPDAPLELYDLEKDESETTNVAAQFPDVVKKIVALMLEARTNPAFEKFQFGTYRE